MGWCCQTGLNCRPLHYQWSALPLSYGSVPGSRESAKSATRRPADPCHKPPARASAGLDRRIGMPPVQRGTAAACFKCELRTDRFPISSPSACCARSMAGSARGAELWLLESFPRHSGARSEAERTRNPSNRDYCGPMDSGLAPRKEARPGMTRERGSRQTAHPGMTRERPASEIARTARETRYDPTTRAAAAEQVHDDG